MRGDVRPVIPSPFLNELPLEEMKRIETSREEDWFDEDPYANDDSFDESYPESWDLPDAASPESGGNSGDEMSSESTDLAPDETTQLTEDELAATAAGKKQQKASVSIASSLKTAADLLSNPTTPLRAYCEGMLVRHVDHGDGTIVSITGRGPKRIARVRFEDEERSFRLAFADLRVIKD
ncbi:MAG: AAA family ATPase, partial [Rubripirellula sp.]